MSLETSAAIIAISFAISTILTLVTVAVLFTLIRRVTRLVSTVQGKTVPIMDSVRHTAETVQGIGDSARVQVQHLESLGSSLVRRGVVYSALSYGIVVAVATLMRRRGA